MTDAALSKIRRHFSHLVIKVRKSLEAHHIDAKDVRHFLLTYFEGSCSIPDIADMSKIFESMTTSKLWRYDHYGPLEELAEEYLPDDDPARIQMTDYLSQLSAFYATTTIIDFLRLSELEDTEEDNQIFSPKKYNRYYRKLEITLKLDKIAEMTLDCMDKLWKALQKKFRLPSLTAVLDNIVEGSLKVTWLVLPNVIEKIKATYSKSISFFQQMNITRVELYGGLLVLYDEKMFVSS